MDLQKQKKRFVHGKHINVKYAIEVDDALKKTIDYFLSHRPVQREVLNTLLSERNIISRIIWSSVPSTVKTEIYKSIDCTRAQYRKERKAHGNSKDSN